MFNVFKTIRRAVQGSIPYGETSDGIRSLQLAIREMGGDPGPIDGIYGLMTEDGLESIFPGVLAPEAPDLDDSDEVDDARIIRYDQPGGLDLRAKRHGGPVPPRSNGRDRYPGRS